MDPDITFAEAFPSLFRAGYRVTYRLTGSVEMAEDATVEALFRASRRWDKIHDHAERWVARVAMNVAIDELRKTSRPRRFTPSTRPQVSHECGTVDRIDLAKELSSLPRKQREVLALRYLGDAQFQRSVHGPGHDDRCC